ncbi:Pecanex-like protein 1 [Plantactinospora sp. GCM10030261]|uniref:Pecanex-like protein 1 n=1 Tax=Plantactinospora sp. GCM10030261 TaxID=3273420 RepID=UPI00360FE3CB
MKNTTRRYARRRPERHDQDPRKRRLIAVLATLGVFGALVAVTQVSLAETGQQSQGAPCPPASASASPDEDASASPDGDASTQPGAGGGATVDPATGNAGEQNAAGNRSAESPAAENQAAESPAAEPPAADPAESAEAPNPVPTNGMNPSGAPYEEDGATQIPGDGQQPDPAQSENCDPSTGNGNDNGLDVLADDCEESRLDPHDGFQNGDRCVSTEFGEVGSAANNPTLLISQAPLQVRRNQPFTLRVSSRNLVRDRFLGAAAGGYYKESSLLNDAGLVRGHFHTACRMLESNRTAPVPDPAPAFFVATEDGGGGAEPDAVRVTIPGLPQRGTAQCAVWAGDGSHRIPMMQRANQIPAFDVVRIRVR